MSDSHAATNTDPARNSGATRTGDATSWIEASRRPPVRPAMARACGRPNRVSASWPHSGTATTKPAAAIAVMTPTAATSKPFDVSVTAMNGL